MSEGVYRPSPAVRRASETILSTARWYPPLEGPPSPEVAVDELVEEPGRLTSGIAAHGLVVTPTDRPVTPAELRRVGEWFGPLRPETDANVQPFVSDRDVLELSAVHGDDVGEALQPFGSGPLRMHTESSTQPAHQQPWLILLACVSPGRPHAGLQTITTSVARVVADLDEDDRQALARTRIGTDGSSCVLRWADGRAVLAVRDFGSPVEWSGDVAPGAVDRALDHLWLSAYDSRGIRGVWWTETCVVALDNTRVLHGRTAAGAGPPQGRILRRVRVLRRD